jgi:hypothetical protein
MSCGCRLIGKLRITREDAKRNEEFGNVLVFSPKAKDEGRVSDQTRWGRLWFGLQTVTMLRCQTEGSKHGRRSVSMPRVSRWWQRRPSALRRGGHGSVARLARVTGSRNALWSSGDRQGRWGCGSTRRTPRQHQLAPATNGHDKTETVTTMATPAAALGSAQTAAASSAGSSIGAVP